MKKFKTLVFKKGSKFQEFYGYDSDFGWVTSSTPINLFDVSMTWDKLLESTTMVAPDGGFSFYVELVTVEIKIIEE